MAIKVIRKRISQRELKKLANESFGEMVKAMVDIKRRIMAVGGELHSDAETLLLKKILNKKISGVLIFIRKNQRINELNLRL